MKEENKKVMHRSDQEKGITNITSLKKDTLQEYNSTSNNNMSNEIQALQDKIYGLLSEGESNAIHSTEIETLLKADTRTVRKAIEDLRRSGTVIISSSKGYFKPETIDEVNKYIKKTEKMARSIFFTLKSSKEYARQMQRDTMQ